MKIGVPKEIKQHEYRVSMVPVSVHKLVMLGHSVLIESGAGQGIGVSDQDYVNVGGHIVAGAEDVFAEAELIVKVKEPQPEECKLLQPGQILFTFLHLAADKLQAELLMASGVSAIAYETVTDEHGRLPLLAPMSEVAGRIAVQAGAHCLERAQGGKGVLLGGATGVQPGKVLVIGGGVVGTRALEVALGMGADVTVLDKSAARLQELDKLYGPLSSELVGAAGKLTSVQANASNLEKYLLTADLVVGAVLIPGASAPKVVSKDLVANMEPGSVIVDVAIDQGGCFATSKPTNFSHPTYIEFGVVHQCVTNLPGSVPRTSAFALNHVTLPFIIELATHGIEQACKLNQHLANGVNVHDGQIIHEAVANALGFACGFMS